MRKIEEIMYFLRRKKIVNAEIEDSKQLALSAECETLWAKTDGFFSRFCSKM